LLNWEGTILEIIKIQTVYVVMKADKTGITCCSNEKELEQLHPNAQAEQISRPMTEP